MKLNQCQSKCLQSRLRLGINYLSLCVFTYLALVINASTPPIFITTLSNFQTSTWVLTTTNPITTSGFSTENTNVTYINLYTSAPNIGYGLGFLNSNYLTTLALDSYVFDIQIVQKVQTSALIQLNRTAGTIQQISLNYIVCDSSFWLDVRQTLVDLSSQTVFLSFTSTRSTVMTLPYKSKSNSSNAQVVYNTIGLEMIRLSSRTYQFQMSTSGRDLSQFNITLQIQANNKIRWVRLCTYSYQAVATTIDAPFFIDWGFLSSFSGSLPDSSGLTLTSTGTIYSGMVSWFIDDSNTVLNYNLAFTLKAYTLTTTSLSQVNFAYVWYRMQSCPDYTFLNGSVCDSCHRSCLTCASELNTSCLTCPLTRQYVSTNRSCRCVTNYVDVGVTACAQLTCSATCLTCAYIDQCGSCLSALQRTLNGTLCSCNSYRIDVFNSTGDTFCYPCFYNCLTCSESLVQTACLSCSASRDKRYFVAANNTCACLDKFYHNASSSSPVCGSCHFSCQTCTNNTACVTCNSTRGRTFNSTTKFCSCLTGNYDDLLNQQCVACSITCLTCNALGCLTCNPATRYLNGTACKCLDGYYDNGIDAACQLCYFPCATCNDSSQICRSCNSALQRYFSNDTCLCADNYYSQNGFQICLSCDITCLTCVNASSSGCLSCNAANFRQYASLTYSCVCKQGYFQTSSLVALCTICGHTCQTCTNITQCLTCNALKFRVKNSSNLCACMDKYYDGGNELCLACNYKCLTCSSNLICDTCDVSTRNASNLTDCPCLISFYDDGISSSCLPCQAQCLTCTNGNNCTSCPSNKVLTATRDCACANGTYYPNCLPCSITCQQCTATANNCTRCNGTAMRYLNSTTAQCPCYQGYFSDGVSQHCQTCYYSCLTCSSYSQCDTCPTNRIKNGSFCSCVSQYYENPLNKNCLSCHYSCEECSAFTQCTSCNAANFRYAKLPLSLCSCMDGYYDNLITQLCYQCDSRCQTCSASSTCLSCNSTINRYFVNSTFQCLCLSGFYEHQTTFLCVKCQYSCETCLNGDQCQTCPVGRTLSLTTGFCTCNTGTFDNFVTSTCNICSYPCQQCSGLSATCTACDSTRTLIVANSTCKCLSSTFDNGTACQSCISNCGQCANSFSCTSCLPGAARNLDGNNLCPCIYGYHDSNGSLLICLKCHYSCLTCSSSTTCDTCFSGRISQPGGLCRCPVNNFFDDGVNGACIPCSYSCLKCSQTPSNCTDCLASANRYLLGAICQCSQGYYDNNVVNCVKCQYSCMSCSTHATCTGCNSSYERLYSSGPYCECQIGFFDDSISQICVSCDNKCASCETVSTKCLTCPETRTINNTANTCPCNTYFYDAGSPTCLSCLYYCQKCVNSAQCTSCPTTRQLQTSTKQCRCRDSYYNVVNQLQCSSCYPLCLTCSDFQVCTTCDTPNNLRYLLNGKCVCQNGYYDTYLSLNNPVCQKCQYTCENCVSETQCSSCSAIAFRLYNVTTKLCSCSNGYYDDTLNTQCLKCPFDCLTCSSATVCLTCPAQRTMVNNRCDCATSFYANGTVCEVCPLQCSSCTNSSYCTACNGVRILVNNNCVCAISTFIIPNSALCDNCQYSCQSCVSLLACSSCNSSLQRFLSGSYCKCQVLYYDDNTTQPCQPCQYSCRTCINGSKCLSCDSTLNRVYNLATSLCDCISGYYEDSSTKLCIKCHYTCVTCINGSACQSCNSLYLRTLNTSSFQCQCPAIQYYDDFTNALCQACDYRCESCQNSSTTCTSCPSATFRSLVINSCTCISGYYDILSLICPKCSHKCVTCTGTADNCTSCSSANLRSVIPNCGCAAGFYDNGINPICQTCDYRCQTCLDGFTCQTCNSTKNRVLNNLNSMCDCMPVFYDDGSNPTCVSCHYTCVTCNHPTLCLTCPPTRVFKNGNCVCNAQHYDDGTSLQCIPCQYSCKSCTNGSECSSCDNTKFRLFNSSTKYCSCRGRFYDNGLSQQLCLACDKTCLTCTNATGCATCPSNVNKTLNLTASPYCSCLYSYYQNYTAGALINQSSICYKCHYSCQICINSSAICTVCDAGANRYRTSAYQCLCDIQYYDDGLNQACVRCYNNCLTCYGTGFSQCLTCDNNSYFLNSSCYPTCPNYYREAVSLSSGLKVCSLCTAFCLHCPTSATVCTLCQLTHRLFSFNSSSILCLDAAPQFYYDNGTDFLPCISPCLHCTAKFKCTDCVPRYYLEVSVTKYCYKCNDYCQSCDGPTAFDCISCIDSYFLDKGLCRKLSCSAYQYVNSLTGCTNCSVSYSHSLTCTSMKILSCQANYILSSSQTSCQTCSATTGFKMSTSGTCVQICGDGIVINDLCDDGNTVNGDGCTSSCKVQKGWSCSNSTSCSLTQTPVLTVVNVVKVTNQNKIQVTLDISVGVRLVTQNFILSFLPKIGYTHNVYATNSQYTQYVLEIYYSSSAQNSNLKIQVISPIQQAQLSATSFSSADSADSSLSSLLENKLPTRRLQTIVAPLSISLDIQIQLLIKTQPPAEYISSQIRANYSQVLFAVLLSLHLIVLLEIAVVVYKRIRVMLLVIDLYQHVTILYLLCTFASYNVLELIITSGSGLQPFVHQFGPKITDIASNYFNFNYTELVLSSCILQVVILISYVLYQALSKNSNNSGHYYYTSFIYVFYIDLMIACIGTFLYVKFQGYLTIYSWAIALLLFIIVNSYTVLYIRQVTLYMASLKGGSKQLKGKIVVPSSSYITSELQLKQKQSNFMQNVLGFDLQSSHDGKSKLSQSQKKSQQSQGNKTQALIQYSQSKSGHSQRSHSSSQQKRMNRYHLSMLNKQSYFFRNIIKLHDLLPVSSNIQSTQITNKIGKYHILVQKHAFPLLIAIFVSIQQVIIRSALLFALFIIILIIFIYQKVQSIKTLRSAKLLVNYLTYIIISILLLIASVQKLSSYTFFNTIIAILVTSSLSFNIVVFIVNIRYSNSYKEYLIQLRNNQILIRNQEIKALQSKKKIYTNVYGNDGHQGTSQNSGLNYNASPIKNIVRNYHNKNQNVYEQDENYQVSGESQSQQQRDQDSASQNHPSQSLSSLPKKPSSQFKKDKTYTHAISSDVSQNQFLRPAQKFIGQSRNQNQPVQNYKINKNNGKNIVTIANKKRSEHPHNQIDETRQEIKSRQKHLKSKNSNPQNATKNNQMRIIDYYDVSPSAQEQDEKQFQDEHNDKMHSRKPRKRTQQQIYLYDKELISKQRISPTKMKSRQQRQKEKNSKEKYIFDNGKKSSHQRVSQINYFPEAENIDSTLIQSEIGKGNNRNLSKVSSNLLLQQKQLEAGPYYKYRNLGPNSKQKKQIQSQQIRIKHNNTKYTNNKQSSIDSPDHNDISRFTKNASRNQQNQSKFSKFNNKDHQNQFNKKHLIDIEDIYDMQQVGDDNQTEIPLGLDNIEVSRARISDQYNRRKKSKKQSKSRPKKQSQTKSNPKSNPKNNSRSKPKEQKSKKNSQFNARQKIQEMSDISSIKQQRELFMEGRFMGLQQNQVQQKDKMTVFNKILKDYQKYKNKKVDPRELKIQEQNLQRLNLQHHATSQQNSSERSQQQQNQFDNQYQ